MRSQFRITVNYLEAQYTKRLNEAVTNQLTTGDLGHYGEWWRQLFFDDEADDKHGYTESDDGSIFSMMIDTDT